MSTATDFMHDHPLSHLTAGNIADAPITTLATIGSLGLEVSRGEEPYVERVLAHPIELDQFRELHPLARHLGVTPGFRAVVDHFRTPAGHTPAGFRIELRLQADGLVQADLARDIAYDSDGRLRPTDVLLSADSANPYEVAPVAPLIANLTCNPGIIYDLFINDPKANVGGLFGTREEVMTEIGRILGPGCDISVELNNPFERDFSVLLEEAERFREILTPWRVVIKVPHTGPVSPENHEQLLNGDKRLSNRYWEPATADAFRAHSLALALREHGFRVNFTLMFEPYQALLALQARPYFINAFIRGRLAQTRRIQGLLEGYDASSDPELLATLRSYLVSTDYLSPDDANLDLAEVRRRAQVLVDYRRFTEHEGADGLDTVRHNLRVLRQANLPDTRLIICSVDGDHNYPDIDRLLTEPEFADMTRRIVLTAEPRYLARFTSANQVISYHRRFLNAAAGQR